MTKEIQDLFNREEWLELTLHNCDYQLTIYRRVLKKFTTRHASSRDCEIYDVIFECYQDNLIPALIEMILLGEKHIHALIIKDPKKQEFDLVVNEARDHQEIINCFYQRFESLNKEFIFLLNNKKWRTQKMKKTITDRRRSQQEIYGKLENCKQHMEDCVNELENSIQSSSFNPRDGRVVWFKQVFNFYIEYLIPALQETLLLDKKHLELVKLNPDKAFKPVKMEVRHHQKLVNQFFHRFEQIVNDFNNLINNQNNKRRA